MGRSRAAAVLARFLARSALDRLDRDLGAVILRLAGAGDRVGEALGEGCGYLEQGFVGGDADRADVAPRHMAAAADQRQDPARIGILATSQVHAEPDGVLEARARPVAARRSLARVQQLLGRGKGRTGALHQHGGDFLGAFLRQQFGAERPVCFVEFRLFHEAGAQAGIVLLQDCLAAGSRNPFDRDLGAAEHRFDTAATGIGNDQHRRALLACATGATGTMLHRLRIAGQLDMHDQGERGQVDAARGDVGRDADPRPLVAQRLERVVALVLAMLARQRHGGEAPLGEAGVEVADIVARRAEQDRRFRLVEAQQVDHGIFDIRGGDGHRLIADVAMAPLLPDGGDAQRVTLVALRQRDDRLGHGGGKEQGAPVLRRRVEDLLQILAEAHVEHLVGFVENGRAQRGEIERAALQMIAQAARRADDDMRAAVQRPPFPAGVHAADAGRDPGARVAIEPFQFPADLQRQLARRRDDERQRGGGIGQLAIVAQQLARHGEAEGNGLARSGLRRDDEVAAGGLPLGDLRLDGGEGFIALGDERAGEDGREVFERHVLVFHR
ncbi:hypothetical protein M529_19780 [Sphingobium ummariense RL-3]|uniref:Uncharacterized protein n=1 Tax=Sphingobium ummariense RL-3 TaxID=1346791 RepID=T0K212_9SPHN|nr:hypothetical protein M529_19780 [Sphingobium ummariense RL-3]